MGWKNGVQYCQRNVEVALEEVLHLDRGYVDDILIGNKREHPGDTEEDLIRQHFRDISSVLLQLGRYDLIASLKKAQFFVKEVEFCDTSLLAANGISPRGSWLLSRSGRSRRPSRNCDPSWGSPTTTWAMSGTMPG